MAYTLRVSVLEQCQLRCNYCLPEGNLLHGKKHDWLTIAQYQTIAHALKPLEVEKVRFTGGEPLLRSDLHEIMHVFRKCLGNSQIALTTNGLRFSHCMRDLISAGLDQVTFHLDTLREDRYEGLMGKGTVRTVLENIDKAVLSNLTVKINVVVQKNVNDDELVDFLLLSQSMPVKVRFIELMNTGSAKTYVKDVFVSGQEILKKIEAHSKVIPLGRPKKSSPAETYLAEKLGVKFGLIASDTQPFCANCNRLRLSADGRLRTCLYEPFGQKLSASVGDKLSEEISAIVARKTSFHPLIRKNRQDFSM
ncbi:MAG TPA: radical SAM protein, partial [Myxococcota bacterium]|nr:radical SAM protein [Myxococcota bacterium]